MLNTILIIILAAVVLYTHLRVSKLNQPEPEPVKVAVPVEKD